MKILSMNDLRHYKVAELDNVLPAMLTVNGEEKYIICSKDEALIIGDLHPRLRIKLNAIVNRARRGMPAPEKYFPPPRPAKELPTKVDEITRGTEDLPADMPA